MLTQIRSATDTLFSHFRPFFAFLHPLPPPLKPLGVSNFKKMKKNTWRHYHFRCKCTINDNHLTYGSSDTKSTRNEKKYLEILSYSKSVPEIMIIGYTVPEICDGCNCYFHFGPYFSLLPP